MLRKLLCVLAVFAGIVANAQTAKEWKKAANGDLNLLVVTDLGRNGYYDQKPVANLLGEVADAIGPEAVIALGDTHHYGGVQSVSDPLWMTNYELIYSHPELMVNWYPICGNHEYRGNTQAVVDYSNVSRRWCMPARYYAQSFENDGTTVKVVFLDTAPLISKYRKDTETYPDAVNQDDEAQLQWLDKTLAEAKEDWVVVVGHHPIYADTDKSEKERTDMQKRVDPILRRHNVPLYICGHIHNFQHISKVGSPVEYVVNSSGSRSRKNVKAIEGIKFVSGASGFSILDVSSNRLTLSMVDRDGNVIHQVIKTR